MMDVRFGVVAEGPTDCVAFSHLIPAYVKEVGINNVSVSFRNLQPFADNTSKSGYSDGGWELVYKWCLSNSAQRRHELYLTEPLFADDMDEGVCDAIILHLDSDICGSIGNKSTVHPTPTPQDPPAQRGNFIRNVLREWLWGSTETDEAGHILVPAVESVEAWLVAGLSAADNDPESHPDIQRRLAEVNYQKYRGRAAPPEMKRLRKSVDDYKKMASDAKINVLRIVAVCPHFMEMVEKIVATISMKIKDDEPNLDSGAVFS